MCYIVHILNIEQLNIEWNTEGPPEGINDQNVVIVNIFSSNTGTLKHKSKQGFGNTYCDICLASRNI